MKSAIRILNYITMLISVLVAVVALFAGCTYVGARLNSDAGLFIGLGLAIACLIPTAVCLITNGKLFEARCKKDILGWSIGTLIVGLMVPTSIVSGILLLCLKDEDFKKKIED